jgi:hypothetical protein
MVLTGATDELRARTEEAARFRLAAEEALSQLEWCVNYLHRIRKDSIAQGVEKHRSLIRREMNRTDD